MDVETDLRIIASIQQGDKSALAELYDRHSAWMMAVAYRILNNRNDAEDLLHDVFLEIWNKAATYNPKRGRLGGWLAVKVRSRALDRLRASNTVKKHISEQWAMQIEAEISAKETGGNVDRDLARTLLKQLSPIQRTVIEFSYFRGYTNQEIADHCQMPLGTVKSGLLRGIQVLRREINKSKVDNSCV